MQSETFKKMRAFTMGWLVAVGVFVVASPAVYRLVATQPPPMRAFDDDATALVAAFGPPDADFTTGTTMADPLIGMRYMIYRSCDVRIALVRRDRDRTGQGEWTIVGQSDESGRVALNGHEALRRLRGTRHTSSLEQR